MAEKGEITVTCDLPAYPSTITAKLDHLDQIWAERIGDEPKRVLIDIAFSREKSRHVLTLTARTI